MPEAETAPRLPSRLARLFYLNVYSSPLLTNSVRREMNLAAVLLLVVTLFEWAMWTSLFNFILTSDVLTPSSKTPLAALAASLFALIIFYFERQMIVHDDIEQGKAKKAMAVRAVYILIAAFITSQPFDLMIFDRPIQTRIHDEEVRKESMARLSDLEQREADLRALAAGTLADDTHGSTARVPPEIVALVGTEAVRGRHASALKLSTTAMQKIGKKKAAIESSKDSLATAQSELRKLSTILPTREISQRKSQLDSSIRRVRAEIEKNRADLGLLEGDWTEADHERAQAEDELKAIKQQRKTRLDGLRGEIIQYKKDLIDWVTILRKSNLGDVVAGPAGWSFQSKPSRDFLDKSRVFADLFWGRSPRWADGTPAKVRRLRNDFNLYDLKPCKKGSASGACDPEEWERSRSEMWLFRTIFVVGVLAALYIPFLILTIKLFLFPRDLKIYYSRLHQALAGQPEASLVTRVEEQVMRGRGKVEV